MNANDRWAPGIGDPSVFGWLTVAAYIVCGLLCFAAARHRQYGSVRRHQIDQNPAAFWICLGFLLLALGVNKQLDLQSLFTQTGRDLAIAQGWYGERATVQLYFITGLAGLGVVLSLVAYLRLRHAIWAVRLGLLGFIFLFGFVVIRAASFHQVDRLIGLDIAGARINVIFELGSILIIACAAIAACLIARDEKRSIRLE